MEDEVKDVKIENKDSSSVSSANESADKAKAQDSKENIYEEESKRSVPYVRFKEKVSETKELGRKLKQLEQEKADAVAKAYAEAQTYYESEISRMQRNAQQAPDMSVYASESEIAVRAYEEKIQSLNKLMEGLHKDVASLKTENETSRLRSQIDKLKDVYPSMDEEYVYVVKKSKPDWSLEECAEYVHKRIEDIGQSKYSKMMEEKKKVATKKIFGEDGKINLKPEERPKTFADAKKRLMQATREAN